jgi:hypothetical protein
MDWETAANQALVTSTDGTSHGNENPGQETTIDQGSIAKDICSTNEPAENEITINQDTITSTEDAGSTSEAVEKETNIVGNTVTSGEDTSSTNKRTDKEITVGSPDAVPPAESTGAVNENVAAKSTTIGNGRSYLGEPDVLPESSAPKMTIDLTIDDSNDSDNSNDDELDKPDLSKLPDSVKIAVEMGELSHEVAEILRKEAIEHAKEEYRKLKEEGRSKFFSFSGTAMIVLTCSI